MGKLISDDALRLSKWFPQQTILRDGSFSFFDETEAALPGALVYCQSLHFAHLAEANPMVSAIITTPDLSAEVKTKALVIHPNPRLLFFDVYSRVFSNGLLKPQVRSHRGRNCRIHSTAVVSELADIADNVTIGPNSVIHDYVRIGPGTRIESNVVVGAEGMLTVWNEDGNPMVVPHAGGVDIGTGVTILSGAVIAKSLFRRWTTLEDYCQIGILANIGHGAFVGAKTVISGNCVIAGRTVIGKNAWVGASSSIAQGLKIGEGCQIKMGSVVVGDIANGEVVSGNFALNHKKNMKRYLEMSR